MFIPQRFESEVALHIVENLRPDPTPGTALILGIHGGPGEGKTWQTERVLQEAGIETLLVSGGQLESGTAGRPGELIREAYTTAGVYIANQKPAVLLLNDADAALGSWGDLVQYTVNTQNVVTELMHLCDYPTRVDGDATRRVPIIMTGNDFTRLYGPLCRTGRMSLFKWLLSDSERHQVVSTIFASLTSEEVAQLLRKFDGRSISFWSSVRARLEREGLRTVLAQHGLRGLAHGLVQGGAVTPITMPFTLDSIVYAAEDILRNDAETHL